MRKITLGSVFFMTILFLGLIFSFQESLAAEEMTCEQVCSAFGWQYSVEDMSITECSDTIGDCTGYPKFEGGKCYYDCEQGDSGVINIPDCDSNTCTCIKKTSCDGSENNCYDEDGCYTCEERKGECESDKDCCESASVLCDTTTGFCYNLDNNFSCISNRDCYSDEECMSGKCDFEGTGKCECSDRGGMCEDYDSHCAGNLRCNDDYNVCYDSDLNLVGEEVCFDNRECESGNCIFDEDGNGTCQGVGRGEVCQDNTDCSSGLLCSGIYCYDSTATLNSGVKCYHDDECDSKICDFGEYYGEGIGKCKLADDEEEEEPVDEEPVEDEPEEDVSPAKKWDGSPCTSNDQCRSGYCYNEICKPQGYTPPAVGSCEWYCEDIETREPPEDKVCICNPISADSFEEIINNIINFIFNIALVLGPLMIVWAGGLYITSGGKPEQTTKAKNIIIYTLTGFAVILLSKGFVAIIKQLLGA